MATKTRSRRATADGSPAPAFPKRMVKLTLGPGNSVVPDVQMAADGDAEAALTESGYKPLELAEEVRPSYPAWRYKSDGSRTLVNSEEEEDALEGDWSDSPTAEQVIPVETDLTRAKQVLGEALAEKLNTAANMLTGTVEAAKKADGNFDPTNVPIARGENPDAKVQASRAVEPTKGRA